MNPRKNLVLALIIAAIAFLSFHLPGLPVRFDWRWHDLIESHRSERTSSWAPHTDLSLSGLDAAGQDLLAAAMLIQRANEPLLFDLPGVVGTGVGWNEAGQPLIKVFVDPGATVTALATIPASLANFPVSIQRAGPFYALPAQEAVTLLAGAAAGARDGGGLLPTSRFDRPVPMGVSTGHTRSTAGTIGAVVTDGTKRYALSNWHVFVPGGKARIGDELLQPGPVDGGIQPADVIGTLAAFEPVALSPFASNRIDAAIAETDQVMPRTPADGYGSPRSETLAASPGLKVQKYGRTTGLTFGEVDAINASINVNYGSAGSQIGRFTGQIVLCCDMSQGGDSGSLIVAHDVDANGDPGPNDRRPVALLFAGDRRLTIANPIDLVLERFGVTVVGDEEGGR